MKTNKSKVRSIKFIFLVLIILLFCYGFDEGCEPANVPDPLIFHISSENINNQTKYYFKSNEKVVIEKIEVEYNGSYSKLW